MPVTERDLLGWMKPELPTPEMQAWADQVGRGDYEIYSEKLNMILDEAREIFVRIGVSGMLHSGDLIVGIYTPGGDMAVASCGTYLHAVSGQLPVKYVIRELLPRPEVGVHDGDVFYCNDARAGGIHNPDQIAIMPVFHEGRLIAWTAAAVHQPETGACEPGGMPVTARSRYDEGMRLLPFKLVDRFQFREDILDVMANMVGRAPRMQIIDTRARVTACDRIRTRLLELVAAKGPEFLQGLFSRMIREAEGGARRRIREWNDGVYQAVAFLDTIGWTQRLLRVSLALHKRGDTIRFDFTGTSPENDGSFNAFAHIVAAHCAVYLYAFAFPDLPISSGTYAPLEFVVPEGCYLNAGPDAAVSNSPSACMPVCAVTNVAFSKLMFDSSRRLSVTSPMGYATAGVNFAGLNQSGVPVSDIAGYQLNTSGGGARSDLDGVDALGFTLGYYGKAPDLEDVEREYPFLHLYQRFRRDSGGMGKYRGGCGTETAWMIHLAEHFVFQSMSSHSRLPSSSGLFGGYPAAPRPGLRVLHSDIRERLTAGDPTLPRSSEELLEQRPAEGEYLVGPGIRPSRQYDRGDVFVGMTPGGTGFGDVLDRDPSLVMEDLRRGLVSSWTAENVCKVAYDPATLTPDLEATAGLRDLERQARLHRGVHYDEFVATWLPKSPPAEVLEYFGAWPTGEKVRDIVRL